MSHTAARPAELSDAGPEAFGSEATIRTTGSGRFSRSYLGAFAVLLLGVGGGGVWGFRLLYATPPPQGTLVIQSDGDATVQVDGVLRAMTPATLRLPAGEHAVVVSRGEHTRQMTLTVRPGAETVHHIAWIDPVVVEVPVPRPVPVPPPPPSRAATPSASSEASAAVAPVRGALALSTPISLGIYDNGRLIGVSEMPQVELAPGEYSLQFVSEALAFRTTQTVRIAPNRTTSVTVTPPEVLVHFNATPWAEVWINGRDIGQTPLGDVRQAIGVHEVEFRHPQLGTKRVAVTVKATGVTRVAVDMKAP
jgi:hypothetical protein